MTVNVPQLSNTATFFAQFSTLNLLANIISTSVLSVGSNTTGDSGVTGMFYANTLVSSFLNTGVINSTSISTGNLSSNGVLSFGNTTSNLSITSTSISIKNSNSSITIATPNTVQAANGQYFLNANGQYTTVPSTAAALPFTSTVVVTNTAFTQSVDSWVYGSVNLATYTVFISDNNANNYYSSKITLMFSSNNVQLTEYAQMTSNTFIGTFSASTDNTSTYLNFTPTSNSTTIKLFRELI